MGLEFENAESGRQIPEFILALLSALIIFVGVIIHTYKSYPSFCSRSENKEDIELQQSNDGNTDNKDNYADEKKHLSKDSALLALLTCFAMLFYFLASFYAALIKSASQSIEFCLGYITPILWCFTLGRGLQFGIYIARLDYLYGEHSEVAYKKSTLMILGTLICIIAIVLMSLQSSYGLTGTLFLDMDEFPHFCAFIVAVNVLIPMLIYDVVISVGSVILFWIPLGKLKASKSDEVNNLLFKYGIKYVALVVVNSGFNLLSYAIIIASGSTVIAPFTNVVGAFSLMLLSPNYHGITQCLGMGSVDVMEELLKKKT